MLYDLTSKTYYYIMTTTRNQSIYSILFLLFLTVAEMMAQEIPYQFRRLGIEEGLLHTDATSIIQDDKGFIWAGTFAGLQRFDGHSFKSFINEESSLNQVYNNRIHKIIPGKGGKIWLLTEGGIKCFDSVEEQFLSQIAEAFSFTDTRKNNIRTIHEDTYGNLYIGGMNGVYVYYLTEEGEVLERAKQPLIQASVRHIFEDKQGSIWFIGLNGLYRLKAPLEKSFQVDFWEVKSRSFQDKLSLSCANLDPNGNLLLGTHGGFLKIEKESWDKAQNPGVLEATYVKIPFDEFPQLNRTSNSQQNVHSIIVDKQNSYWIGTWSGLIKVSTIAEGGYTFQCFQHLRHDPNSISSNKISSLFLDHSQTGLWVGLWGGGINYVDLDQKRFYLLKDNPLTPEKGLTDCFIRAIYGVNKNELWIGTRESGLNYYHMSKGEFRHFRHEAGNPHSIDSDRIKSIAQDTKGRLWIGTIKGLNLYDPQKNIFRHIHLGNSTFSENENYNIYSIGIDKFGQIWAGSWVLGLFRIKEIEKDSFEVKHVDRSLFTNGETSSNKISFILSDSIRPEILVSTNKGLDHLFLDQMGEITEIRHYRGQENRVNGLSSDFIWPTVRMNDSTIWLGTLGGGLNKLTLKTPYVPGEINYHARSFTVSQGAPSNDIESLLADAQGNLWLGGKGLSKFNPRTEEFTHFDKKDGLQGNSFKVGASFKEEDGRLYFGGTEGITYFYPNQIKKRMYQAPIAFTKLTVNNQNIGVNQKVNGWEILPKGLAHIQEIELNHLQSSFTLHFSSLHFANPQKCRYRYMLEGFNEKWVDVPGDQPSATFSNLAYGTYTLKVLATNSDGLWMNREHTLVLHMLPPWYKTPLAKVAYFLIFTFLISAILFYLFHWNQLKKNLTLAQIEKEKREEIHQLKLQFFTNISHEFRTPLSMICLLVEKLFSRKELDLRNKKDLNLIQVNVNRMLGLVNELMDFRKVESGRMSLRVKEDNVCQFVREVSEQFEAWQSEKEIELTVETCEEYNSHWFDKNIIEKILFNLLSNSFKYTEKKGRISLQTGTSESLQQLESEFAYTFHLGEAGLSTQYAWIRIRDNGVGISADSISHIFDRYFRIEDSQSDPHLGSGVGLALVKSLVLLHKGEITVHSERNKGTEFLIQIPVDKACYTSREQETSSIWPISKEVNLGMVEQQNEQGIASDLISTLPVNGVEPPREKLLILEDNLEMQGFLENFFSDTYEVRVAQNGQEGLAICDEFLPTAIISDLMMPHMNGHEFCRNIKQNLKSSHIPIILLTAKTGTDTHLQGIESGADLYLSKPFSLKLLGLHVEKLINRQKLLKEKYQKDLFVEAHELVHSQRDREFMHKLTQAVEANLDNIHLDVSLLCKEIGMSRTNLYNKIKNVTGQSIGEFIRRKRLRHAAHILTTEYVPIVEVMERIGLRSQSYFTKSFKKEFGLTPSQFLQKIEKEKLEFGKAFIAERSVI